MTSDEETAAGRRPHHQGPTLLSISLAGITGRAGSPGRDHAPPRRPNPVNDDRADRAAPRPGTRRRTYSDRCAALMRDGPVR
jgi:hypothetical protein